MPGGAPPAVVDMKQHLPLVLAVTALVLALTALLLALESRHECPVPSITFEPF